MQDRFKFRYIHLKSKKMYAVKNICFEGKPIITVNYRPILKYSLDDGYLMQCTGLHDKNGKLIYEGDIVTKKYITPMGELTDENDTDFRKEIKLFNGSFGIFTETEFKPLQCFINYHCGEYISNRGNKIIYEDCNLVIIGNIYETPELLEVQNG